MLGDVNGKKVPGSTFKGSGLRVQGAEVPRFAFQAARGRQGSEVK